MAPPRVTSWPIRLALATVLGLCVALLAWIGQGTPPAPAALTVKVRWAPAVSESARRSLEARLHLVDPDQDEGRTWRYRVTDPSPATLRQLVTDPAVEDTANIDRVHFRPAGDQDPGAARMARAEMAGLVAALVTLAGFAWLARRRQAGSRQARGAEASAASASETAEAWLARQAAWPRAGWVAAALAAPLIGAVVVAMWTTPYPIHETVGILEDVHLSPDSFFNPAARSWYRPFYFLLWRVLWTGTGSLRMALLLFRVVEVAAVVALAAGLLRLCRPRTALDVAAASFALAVLVGSPGFRDNLELPLLMTLIAMPLVLVLLRLLEQPPRPWHAPAAVAILALAVGFKEQGLVLVPLVLVLWWTGAPGATTRVTAAVFGAGVAYLAVRFSTRGTWHPFEQAVGLGFQMLSADEANARFGHAPVPIYAYNVAATLLNLLVSEPTTGYFRVTDDLRAGHLAAWEVNHVAGSLGLTVLLIWWGWRTWRHRGRPWSADARLVAAIGAVVAASAALGFNYARDRLAGMAVVMLALGSYHAVRALLARTAVARGAARAALSVAVLALAVAWQLRALGTVEFVRYGSERAQREWLTAAYSQRLVADKTGTYASLFERLRPQGLNPAAAVRHAYPRWLTDLLGER